MSRKKEKTKKNFMKVSNSRKLYLPIYLMILILIAVVIFIKYKGLVLNNLVLIVVGLFILFAIKFTEVHRFSNSYEINQNSLVHRRGIFNRKTKSVDFFGISDIEVKQNFWQRLIGYGDVSVRLYSGKSDNPVKNINKPAKFAEFLRKMMNAKRRGDSKW